MQLVLIRHAHSQANAKGILSGRLPGNDLSEKGIAESKKLAQRLGSFNVASIRISPMPRCLQTIQPWLELLPAAVTSKVVTDEDLNEVDYGSWSGKKLSTLSRTKSWKIVQNYPSAMLFPNGESIAHMQQRAIKTVSQVIQGRQTSPTVLVSHGDVIKAIVAHALGTHLDNFQRIVIDPCSVTVIEYNDLRPRIVVLNDTRSDLNSIFAKKTNPHLLLGGGGGR